MPARKSQKHKGLVAENGRDGKLLPSVGNKGPLNFRFSISDLRVWGARPPLSSSSLGERGSGAGFGVSPNPPRSGFRQNAANYLSFCLASSSEAPKGGTRIAPGKAAPGSRHRGNDSKIIPPPKIFGRGKGEGFVSPINCGGFRQKAGELFGARLLIRSADVYSEA